MADLIDRQAVIDALGEKPLAWTEGEYELGLQRQWESDVEAIKELPSEQPDLDSAYAEGYTAAESKYRKMLDEMQYAQPDSKDLVEKIKNGITASDGNSEYFIGLRNGMRWCLSLIDDKEPIYESSALPDLDEWCTDCKEYDSEHHCCPRWNRVIRETLKDAQPEIIRCNSCRHDNNCAIQDIAQTGGKFFCGFAQRKEENNGNQS